MRAFLTTLWCTQFVTYVHMLEVHIFHPFFLEYEISPVHITPHCLLANPINQFLSWSLVILSLSCPSWLTALLIRLASLWAKMLLPHLNGSHLFQAVLNPQRGFHDLKTQNPLVETSCANNGWQAESVYPFTPSPAGLRKPAGLYGLDHYSQSHIVTLDTIQVFPIVLFVPIRKSSRE